MPTEAILEQATSSLERVQGYDPSEFDRAQELGASLNLKEAISPAARVVELFQRLPVAILAEFPDNILHAVQSQADQVYNAFVQAEEFNTAIENPAAQRTAIIKTIDGLYDPAFQGLYSIIAFSAARATDFQRLERQGRAAVQSIEDRTSELSIQLQGAKDEAEQILQDIRKTAAEQGVSQQAIYFKDESDHHDSKANEWLVRVWCWAAALILYSVGSFFLHNIPGIAPTNQYEAFQLISSKVLVFAVLAYMLFLAARNYMSHRHNAITNKHRQNALVTFKALVDAGGTRESRDVVLRYAASSVFLPQDTGLFGRNASGGPSANTLVELGSGIQDTSA